MSVTLDHNTNGIEFDEHFEDVIGTGTLLKKIIKSGDGDRPSDNDIVKISLSYHGLEDIPPEEVTFILGYLLNVEGIELACKFMNVGEIAIFKIKSHLVYGDIGLTINSYHIPPHHDLVIQISLISIEEHQKILYHSPIDEILVYCSIFRERGKFYFGRDELDRAIFIYNKILNILTDRHNDKPDVNLLMEMSIFQNNLATCHFKIDDLKKALELSTAAVFSNPNNIKAIYKHLIILETLKRYDEGIYFIKKCIVNLPLEKEVLEKKLDKFIMYQKEVDNSERLMYRKMIQ